MKLAATVLVMLFIMSALLLMVVVASAEQTQVGPDDDPIFGLDADIDDPDGGI